MPAPRAIRSSSGSCPGCLSPTGVSSRQRPSERAEVPATVRDVVRDRMAGLDTDAQALLQIAALIGRDVELRLLARAADVDVPDLPRSPREPVEALGLLGTTPDDPFSLRFAHDLVRESVVRGYAATRRRPGCTCESPTRWNTRPRRRQPSPSALPTTCGPPGRSPTQPERRTALIRAGSSAAAKSALDVAERQLRSATQVARTAGLAELELSAL